MLKIAKKEKQEAVSKKLEAKLEKMIDSANTLEDYKEAVDLYRKYQDISSTENIMKRRIDPNTVLTLACSLISILLILNFEKVNVLTSKAIGFVPRRRV